MRKFLFSLLLLSSTASYAQNICIEPFDSQGFKAVFKKVGQESAVDSWAANKTYLEEFEKLALKNPAFRERYNEVGKSMRLRGRIDSFDQIPFESSHSFRPPKAQNNEVLIARLEALDPEMQAAFMAAYNALNDAEVVRRYIKELYAESLVWASKQRNAEKVFSYNLYGKTTDRSIAVTIVRRLKGRGDVKFTKITRKDPVTGKYIISGKHNVPDDMARDSNGAFRAAVQNGPFIDAAFPGYSGHGAYAHMIQRDIIHPYLQKHLGDDVSRFYGYLGSKQGIALWADLFDSGNTSPQSFCRPEYVTEAIFNQIGRL